MKKLLLVLLLCGVGASLSACKNDSSSKKKATSNSTSTRLIPELSLTTNARGKAWVQKVTEQAHTQRAEAALLRFSYAGKSYQIMRNCGQFAFRESHLNRVGDTVTLVFDNMGIQKKVNHKKQTLPDTTAERLTLQLSRLAELVEFPFGLNSTTVRKKYLGEQSVKGQAYAVVKTAFKQEAGQRVSVKKNVLWIDKENHSLQYLALADPAPHLLKVTNSHKIDSLVVHDYAAYRPKADTTIALKDFAQAYQKGQLRASGEIKFNKIEIHFKDRNCN